MSKSLMYFMKDNFDFSTFKKCGLYPKELKATDYEGQAKIICGRLGLKNIFDYGKHEIRCHITFWGERPLKINKKGELVPEPFVSVSFPNQMQI